MGNTLYRHLLKSSYLITKKYKRLWWLGLFIAFLGSGGEYQTLVDYLRQLINQGPIITNINHGYLFLTNMTNSWGAIFSLALLAAILIIAILFFFWIVATCFGVLMKTVADLPTNLPPKLNFSAWETWDQVKNKSIKILGLYLVAKVLTYAILALIIVPFLYLIWQSGNFTLNVIVTFFSFLIFVPLSIIISFVTKYAAAYVVLRQQRFGEAWTNGWRLFFSNWLISLEMALVMLIINLLISLVFSVVALLIFSPGFFLGIVQLNAQPQLLGGLTIASTTIIIILSAFLAAIVSTFQTVAWTLLFLRLNEPFPALSKLIRLASHLPKLINRFKTPTPLRPTSSK
ncbi:MAG: hypothetical protein NTV81_02945 [Candidatus Komeilibacteria bacterium]|nr:hypothetical protein [Candidatus Komeilibacteria bacterium]